MYISGGFTDGHFSDAMLCYNPKHDIWERRTPMQNPRGWHQMVTVKGLLPSAILANPGIFGPAYAPEICQLGFNSLAPFQLNSATIILINYLR